MSDKTITANMRAGLKQALSAGNKPLARRVTWQHEDTGYIFTKEIPEGIETPVFPRRFVIREEVV